jgi:hypothetical protein
MASKLDNGKSSCSDEVEGLKFCYFALEEWHHATKCKENISTWSNNEAQSTRTYEVGIA